ncbi:MAG: leucyl aminopeptidase [Actinobacteria bacterium]|nr:leucyl aminopeptidase [Actinomycetota bacterium]
MTSISLAASPSKSAFALRYSDAGFDPVAADFAPSKDALTAYGAKTTSATVARVPGPKGNVLVVGSNGLSLRDFGAVVRREALTDVSLVAAVETEAQLLQLLEGLLLGGKTPTRFKKATLDPVSFEVVVPANLVTTDFSRTEKIAGQIVAIRELINLPANELWPDKLAQEAKSLATGLPIDVEVWDENRLEAERCGGILSVGKGSVRPPRLVKLSYHGGGKHIALVGKGITFDTGGLSLKPAEGMVGMKYDMAGSATVLGAILGIATLGLKVNVTAYMCLAENMPSGSATRPGDVITIRNGKTVEVLNTDAEGRLVLADGLSLAQETNPDHIIDVATLTGAARIALGDRYAGVMGHGDAVKLTLESASAVDELLWEMPLPPELRTILDSEIADLANVKIGNRAGGMMVGAQFLADFVNKETSWAHLDIAGPANNDAAPYGVIPKGASGIMIRSLIELAQRVAQ